MKLSARLHSHPFKGVTTYINGHLHLYSGVSSVSPDVPGHTHLIAGETNVANGHSHSFNMETLTYTKVDSAHYHYYRGNSGFAQGHSHPMEGTTFVFGE